MSLLSLAGVDPARGPREWWEEHWKGMPDYEQESAEPWKTIEVLVKTISSPAPSSPPRVRVHFARREDLEAFSSRIGVHISEQTREVWWPGHGEPPSTVEEFGKVAGLDIHHGKWSWYPAVEYQNWSSMQWVGGPSPRHPIYIPSKGRAANPITSRYLSSMGVPHSIVVEEQQLKDYEATRTEHATLIVLDPEYRERYEPLGDFGDKSLGSGPARNFIWDHSVAAGADWHWIMDDNIQGFYRLHQNAKRLVRTGAVLRAMEDFCGRYENIAMAGPHYEFFVLRRVKTAPFILNTRAYSCNLIRNDVPFRWRGRYNEDVILSLDMLEAGWCTVQFHAFLQKKVTTQIMGGGNTEAFYADEGTLPKSEMLVKAHPRVARLAERWGRWHHHVDYRPFEVNHPRLRQDAEIPDDVNDYGMTLVPSTGSTEGG